MSTHAKTGGAFQISDARLLPPRLQSGQWRSICSFRNRGGFATAQENPDAESYFLFLFLRCRRIIFRQFADILSRQRQPSHINLILRTHDRVFHTIFHFCTLRVIEAVYRTHQIPGDAANSLEIALTVFFGPMAVRALVVDDSCKTADRIAVHRMIDEP